MLTVAKGHEALLAVGDPVSLGQFLREFGFAGLSAVLIVLLIALFRQYIKERKDHDNYVESTHKQQMEVIEKLNITIGESTEVQRRSNETLERAHRAIDRCPHSAPPGPRDN